VKVEVDWGLGDGINANLQVRKNSSEIQSDKEKRAEQISKKTHLAVFFFIIPMPPSQPEVGLGGGMAVDKISIPAWGGVDRSGTTTPPELGPIYDH
jgi:hypothetical protein